MYYKDGAEEDLCLRTETIKWLHQSQVTFHSCSGVNVLRRLTLVCHLHAMSAWYSVNCEKPFRPALTQQWWHAGSACSHAACVISPRLAACLPRGAQTQAADKSSETAASGSRAALPPRHLCARCLGEQPPARLASAADVTTPPRYRVCMHEAISKNSSIHSDRNVCKLSVCSHDCMSLISLTADVQCMQRVPVGRGLTPLPSSLATLRALPHAAV